jgi:DNA-binding transcriptional MerR regulator
VKRKDLASLMESLSVADLKHLLEVKGKLEALTQKKKELEKNLAEVERRIAALLGSAKGLPAAAVQGAARKGEPGVRRRIAQPSLASVIADVLREHRKPMKVNDIAAAVVEKKKYRTRARDFKSQIRILLYKNEKKWFKKVAPGLFTIAAQQQNAK